MIYCNKLPPILEYRNLYIAWMLNIYMVVVVIVQWYCIKGNDGIVLQTIRAREPVRKTYIVRGWHLYGPRENSFNFLVEMQS